MSEPLTRFGDAAFQMVHEGEWFPLWDQESYSAQQHIPGSDTTILFLLGNGPLTLPVTIEFDTYADYAALAELRQSTDTLRMPATVAESALGVEVNYFGTIYTEIANVTLLTLTQPAIALGGSIQANAVFYRGDRTP